MDDTDRRIQFDDDGRCDHCAEFDRYVAPIWSVDNTKTDELSRIRDRIVEAGKGRDFDCILGVSGGLDSAYLAHVAVKEMGLRPLLFHVDGGWNNEIATRNIERMVDGLDVDLHTEVINWPEMREFQLGYLRSGLSNVDVPQDHAFIASLYNYASKHGIKFILNGGNYSTECIKNPLEWAYYGTDRRQLRYIRKTYCPSGLPTYPFSNILRHKLYLRYIRKIEVVKPLNLVPYRRDDVIAQLESEYGFQYYGRKHYESKFTSFYEGYWLPTKFGYDTRKVQLSSLILTGQLERSAAEAILEAPPYNSATVDRDFEFIASKLEIDSAELADIWSQPNRTYRDYPSSATMFRLGAKALRLLGQEMSIKR